ncbi:uncharacterized protein LY79DRAFT_164560 [Colletotrichum navitas]|uniref:Uncharacterized protein n=1 Tax=Colletotrichum navitas TaxID=681940 RepID=A0AAD8Q1S6_9PEZI|nr:uncharacterized protein LY79DRAFT_164560 [Colletotrichum navitas]KAK1593935.1 hypothetical protein LY79DRAFT_164560 [Colletotrichum navitas]
MRRDGQSQAVISHTHTSTHGIAGHATRVRGFTKIRCASRTLSPPLSVMISTLGRRCPRLHQSTRLAVTVTADATRCCNQKGLRPPPPKGVPGAVGGDFFTQDDVRFAVGQICPGALTSLFSPLLLFPALPALISSASCNRSQPWFRLPAPPLPRGALV